MVIHQSYCLRRSASSAAVQLMDLQGTERLYPVYSPATSLPPHFSLRSLTRAYTLSRLRTMPLQAPCVYSEHFGFAFSKPHIGINTKITYRCTHTYTHIQINHFDLCVDWRLCNRQILKNDKKCFFRKKIFKHHVSVYLRCVGIRCHSRCTYNISYN